MGSNGNGNGAAVAPANGNGTAEILRPRAEWIVNRKAEVARTGDTNVSQMHFARLGRITEEMAFVAEREKIDAALVRDEVAAGPADYSGEHQPSRAGADGHRHCHAVQGEREYRQFRDYIEY